MNRKENLRVYFALPWVKAVLWIVSIIVGILLIGVVANYLTMVVFHF